MHGTGTEITFLSGTRTVGGVQVLVSTPRSAVLFDLGVVGNPAIVRDTTLFHELMRPRADHALRDYLRAGMAPHVEGIYHPAAAPGGVAATTAAIRSGPLHAGRPLVDLADRERAVFVSHLHDDHMQLIEFLAADTPLLMSERSVRLHAALVAAGAVPATPAAPEGLPCAGHRVVGDLAVRPVPVDHDVPGSSGLLIETADGTRIAYTGDWRRHGSSPELMQGFAERCHGVDLLITEASTTGHDAETLAAQVGEDDIAPVIGEVIDSTPATVYLTMPERHLARHEQIRLVAADRGRRMLLSAATARLWFHCGGEDVTLADAAVWADDPDGEPPPGVPSVTTDQVAAQPDRWVAELPAPLWPLWLEIGAGPDDTFVHCNGHPYNPHDPRWPVLRTWVRRLGMRWRMVSAHGHALPDHLAQLVQQISPGLVVPVHSNAPDAFPEVPAPVRSVTDGELIRVGAGRVTAPASPAAPTRATQATRATPTTSRSER